MNKHLTAIIAAGAAALTLAAPAMGASLPLPTDAAYDVPAGKIEHTVKIERVFGPNAVASHTKTAQWLTRDRSHTIVTDVATGRLVAETVASATEIRTYDAADRVLRVERRRRGARGLPVNSFTFEAAVQRAYLEQGYVRVIGETQVAGRRALVTENVAGGRWRSEPADTRTVAVVDAETFTLYERTTTHPRGDFTHRQQFPVNRVIDATPENVRATMAMKERKGVRVLVPSGQMEHSVVVRKVEGSRAVPSHERTERWMTATHSRTVVTDLKTGRVRIEIITTPTETRIRENGRTTVRRSKKPSRPPYQSAAEQAAIQQRQLEQGKTRVVGEKVVGGRRALIVESVPGRWRSDEPASRTVAVIDAETFALYERTTGLPGGELSQTEVYELVELVAASDAKLKRR